MLTLSATCLSIALADKRGTLHLSVHASRLGGSYVAINDDVGVIEVADDLDAAQRRIEECRR